MVLHGTTRVQQAVIRILIRILPFIQPQVLATLTLLDITEDVNVPAKLADPSFVNSGLSVNQQAYAISAIKYLLRVIGLGFHRTTLDSVSRVYACFREGRPLPLLGDVNINSAVSSHEIFAHFLPNSIAACCLEGDVAGNKHSTGCFGDGTGTVLDGYTSCLSNHGEVLIQSVNSDIVQQASGLSSELVRLVRKLMELPHWKDAVASTISAALTNFGSFYRRRDGRGSNAVNDEQRLKYVEGLAALSIVGGHTDSIRAGARVTMQHADVNGVVLGFDDAACLAHIFVVPWEGQGFASSSSSVALRRFHDNCAGAPIKPGLSTLRVNADEIFLHHDEEVLHTLWSTATEGSFSALRTATLELSRIFLSRNTACPLVPPPSIGKTPTTGVLTCLGSMTSGGEQEIPDGQESQSDTIVSTIVNTTVDQQQQYYPPSSAETDKLSRPCSTTMLLSSLCNSQDAGTQVCEIEDAVFGQIRAMTLKVLFSMIPNGQALMQMLSLSPKLLQKLLLLAIQPDMSISFITLEEAELRASIIRKRLFQLVPHDLQINQINQTSVPSSRESTPTGDEASTKHVGASLLNCPACLLRLPGGIRYNKVVEKRESDLSPFDEDEQMGVDEDIRNDGGSPSGDQGIYDGMDDQDHDPYGEHDHEDADYQVPSELQDQLMIMGFPEEWCALALRENNNDIISASSWIVDNLDMLTRLSELHRSADEQCDVEDEDGEEDGEDDGDDQDGGEEDGRGSRSGGDESDDRSSDGGADDNLLEGENCVLAVPFLWYDGVQLD